MELVVEFGLELALLAKGRRECADARLLVLLSTQQLLNLSQIAVNG